MATDQHLPLPAFVKINRVVKEHLDAADRALADCDTVKSSRHLWQAVRIAAVSTLKARGLPHDTDDEILLSIMALDKREYAAGKIQLSYSAASIFRDNASHDFLELDEFLFCRPSATEFADRMQELSEANA